MAVLDASIVNVAAPSIHASLRVSGAGLQLVVAGYIITYAVLLVTGARLGDILGHRRVFLGGLVLFTLTSLGCGLAGGLLISANLFGSSWRPVSSCSRRPWPAWPGRCAPAGPGEREPTCSAASAAPRWRPRSAL